MFKFHKIGNHIASGWYCLIDSDEALQAHLDHMTRRVLLNWTIIKASPENKEGHTATVEAGGYKTLITLEMERRGIEKISFVDGIEFLSRIATKSTIDIYKRNGSVYVTSNGGCRPDTSIREYEELLDKTTSKNYVFPTKSKKDFKIIKWPGGNHYYITENGNTIELYGHSKWNRAQDAQRDLDCHWSSYRRNREKYDEKILTK